MKVTNQNDLVTGILFSGLGLAVAFGALSYEMGSPGAMGPGYFPFLSGLILAVLGVFVLVASVSAQDGPVVSLESWDIRKIVIVLGSIVAFAATLEPFGLFVAIACLVVLSSLASPRPSWRVIGGTTGGLWLLVWLIFILMLRLPFPLLPFFLR